MDERPDSRGRPKKLRPDSLEHTEADRLAHQKAIGDRVRRQRELHGWSTADLAHRAGLTAQAIRQLELGERAPLTWTVYLLAQALDCGAGWLAFGG